MHTVEYINTLREDLDTHLGEQVKIKKMRGRKREEVLVGTMVNTYPNVFTIEVDKKEYSSIYTYSYIDLLTKTIKLNFVKS
ncbi:MAG: Veg family protein [Lachnospirales bacterium]